jgi:deoxyribose-phosphate aldolase
MTDASLVESAQHAKERAYAPYSRFRVGAALATAGGEVYRGANVENASYGLTVCAERVAIAHAVSRGGQEFVAIAIATDSPEFVYPCGACLQVMSEFVPDLRIILVNGKGETRVTSLRELLPSPFQRQSGRLTPLPPLRSGGIAAMIDHTLLKPEATQQDIERICHEGIEYGFAAVCVHPFWVDVVARLLAGSPVRVATVSGFPSGMSCAETKAHEAGLAVARGAHEVDMVMNVGALKSGSVDVVRHEVSQVCKAVGADTVVKVILETALLSDEEKVTACTLIKGAGAHFVKTSTGFGPGGATVEDVRLMRQAVGPEMGVKASGGIRTYEQARAMVDAGATRIGTSSGIRIVGEEKGSEN